MGSTGRANSKNKNAKIHRKNQKDGLAGFSLEDGGTATLIEESGEGSMGHDGQDGQDGHDGRDGRRGECGRGMGNCTGDL